MMDKSFSISINLLPKQEAEIVAKQKKFKKVQFIGTMVIAGLLFLISATFGLVIFQNSRLKQSDSNLTQAKKDVEQSKTKEVTLLVLKDRIKEIQRLKDQPSKSALVLEMVNKLVPQSVSLSIISIDKNSNANLTLNSSDVEALDNLLSDLIDQQKNEDLVTSVTLDNFSRGKEGTYRVALKLKSEDKGK